MARLVAIRSGASKEDVSTAKMLRSSKVWREYLFRRNSFFAIIVINIFLLIFIKYLFENRFYKDYCMYGNHKNYEVECSDMINGSNYKCYLESFRNECCQSCEDIKRDVKGLIYFPKYDSF